MSPRFQIATFSALMAAVMAPGIATAQARAAVKNRPITTPSTTPTVQATKVTSITASPATISFSATDPDLGLVTGSSAATIVYDIQGSTNVTWTLGIQASSSTFTGCTTVPASAVTATCSNVTVTNITGASGTGACGSAVTLSSSSLTTVASGLEGTKKDDYTVAINLTLSDSWQYIAATSPTCPLTISYTLNAP